MKRMQVKDALEALTPSEAQKNRLLEKLLHTGQEAQAVPRMRWKQTAKWGFATGGVSMILIVCFLVGSIVFKDGGSPLPFTVVAYAADRDSSSILIREGTRVELPFGRLIRDQMIPQADGSVTYNTFLQGSNYFSVTGDGIASVTYTSEQGELIYVDTVKRDNNPDYIRAKREAASFPGGGSVMVESNPRSYMQEGKQVTATYYKEIGDRSLAVQWKPWYASKEMANDANVNPAHFLREKIKVEVTFHNGKTAAQSFYLSFEEDGTLVAELGELTR